MQQPIGEDATFNPVCVQGSIDRRRKPGPLRAGEWGGRAHGGEGMHTILSIDPAGTGEAFMLAYAIDRTTKERWVLNCWMGNNTTPAWYADMIEMIVPEYGVNEVVIESNGYASWLIHDQRIVNFCRQRGVPVQPNYTSRNKQDPDFGVASMSSLFGSTRRINDGAGREVHNDDNLIHIPDPSCSNGVKALTEQLVTWQPGKLGKQLRMDGPMALWFAETRARTLITGGDAPPTQFLENRYLSRRAKSERYVLPAGWGG